MRRSSRYIVRFDCGTKFSRQFFFLSWDEALIIFFIQSWDVVLKISQFNHKMKFSFDLRRSSHRVTCFGSSAFLMTFLFLVLWWSSHNSFYSRPRGSTSDRIQSQGSTLDRTLSILDREEAPWIKLYLSPIARRHLGSNLFYSRSRGSTSDRIRSWGTTLDQTRSWETISNQAFTGRSFYVSVYPWDVALRTIHLPPKIDTIFWSTSIMRCNSHDNSFSPKRRSSHEKEFTRELNVSYHTAISPVKMRVTSFFSWYLF